MLDLRSISNESTEYKWYPLARNRYKTHKPQVRLMLSTEEPGADTQQVIVTLIVIDHRFYMGHKPDRVWPDCG